MSTGIKESVELIRLFAVMTGRCVAHSADGVFSRWDGAKVILESAGDIWDGIAGIAKIPGELRDLTIEESDAIIDEVVAVLEKSGRFTHRERDVARKILEMCYRNLVDIDAILKFPPPAELA